ncbi:hypothetical protein AN641_01270 [Candidatus Epulonipiscioides gigas]|nr:hypothetical protein AN641_01270 [Epulopiscium sp. SCG-C07WGA-EpuloA2]
MNNNVDDLKNKYHEGYRCIYKDKSDGLTVHLKHFNKEITHTISTNQNMEIGEIEDFLDKVDFEKKAQGHDVFCTHYEVD